MGIKKFKLRDILEVSMVENWDTFLDYILRRNSSFYVSTKDVKKILDNILKEKLNMEDISKIILALGEE